LFFKLKSFFGTNTSKRVEIWYVVKHGHHSGKISLMDLWWCYCSWSEKRAMYNK